MRNASFNLSKHLTDGSKQLLLAALYFFSGYFMEHRFAIDGVVTVIWPGSGLALAGLLMGGRRYILGVLIGSLLLNMEYDDAYWAIGGKTLANVTEAYLGVLLLRRNDRSPFFLHSLSDYKRLILLGGGLASLVAAIIGAFSLLLAGYIQTDKLLQSLLFWWMGDALGVALVTPFIFVWWHEWNQPIKLKKVLEGMSLIGISFIVGQIIFLDWFKASFRDIPKAYIMFFLIALAAMRTGMRGVTLLVLLIAMQALWGAYHEVGYFAHDIARTGLRSYWAYMLIVSLVGMVLASYINEIKQALKALQLKDAALNAVVNGVVITDIEGNIEWANQAFSRLTGFCLDEVYGLNPRHLVKSGKHDESFYQNMWRTILSNHSWHGELINRRKDGSLYDEELSITPLVDGSGKITNFVAIKQEITARKQSEKTQQALLDLLKKIADRVPGVIYQYRLFPDGRSCFPFASEAIREIYRVSPEEVCEDASKVFAILHPDDLEAVSASILLSARDLTVWHHEYRVKFADGSVNWLLGNAMPQREADGSTLWHGFITDVTERKLAEDELRIAATAFESLQGMLITDANGDILRVNRAFTHVTGYTIEDVKGRNPRMFGSGRHNAEFYAAMWDRIHHTGAWEGEIWNRRKNGEVYPEYLSITAVKDKNGIVTHYVASLDDITLSKAAEDEIKNLAFYDPLTRLPNRRLLFDRLKQALIASKRSGKEGALLFIDLDNFKALNDTLGHDVGDLLLQQVARRLTACLRASDTVSRFGGDEFVVILEDLSGTPLEAVIQTELVSDKILASLNEPFRLGSYEYRSTPSIGVTLFDSGQSEVEELLKQADIAMYQAKKAGRNTLCFFNPEMQASITARVALEAGLRLALAENQLKLHYQLQVNHDDRVVGAEVLLRWQHPELGLVLPVDFISLAEETGLIVPIGRWVIERACIQIKKWEQAEHTRHLQLAVNVSARQFHQDDFVEQVHQALNHAAIQPDKLKFELTESLVLDNIDETIQKITALRQIGVRFSMDDFGTGYSSLAYLSRLPIDQLKIDQSFVQNMTLKVSDSVIVQTIIGMANNLGMEVIAEGVETEEQRIFLEQHGCSICQGYLFGKPVSLEEFELLLQRGIVG